MKYGVFGLIDSQSISPSQACIKLPISITLSANRHISSMIRNRIIFTQNLRGWAERRLEASATCPTKISLARVRLPRLQIMNFLLTTATTVRSFSISTSGEATTAPSAKRHNELSWYMRLNWIERVSEKFSLGGRLETVKCR